MTLTLTTTAFENGARIPDVHTCRGDDVSPPLSWEGEPADTVTFALIMEDPDAPGGTFTHWIVYNLPKDCHSLEKVIPIEKNLGNGGIHGKNDFGKYGYRGPCPPTNERHRYSIKIFALSKKLRPESANRGEEFYQAINGLILDSAQYTGIY